jgi:hypothetical protein
MPREVSKTKILENLPGHKQRSGGKPQEDSNEILWDHEVYQEAERHP